MNVNRLIELYKGNTKDLIADFKDCAAGYVSIREDLYPRYCRSYIPDFKYIDTNSCMDCPFRNMLQNCPFTILTSDDGGLTFEDILFQIGQVLNKKSFEF